MTYERKIENNSITTMESIDLLKRPVDELAAFIGGDADVFKTLLSEVEQLGLSETEKADTLTKLSEAAMISKVPFPKVDQVISGVEEL